ncbi:MAG: hypothetical protein AB7V27_01530 [Candidatus Binatia bacterium]
MLVGVLVGVLLGVHVAVAVLVSVAVCVAVAVAVRVLDGVLVGVGLGASASARYAISVATESFVVQFSVKPLLSKLVMSASASMLGELLFTFTKALLSLSMPETLVRSSPPVESVSEDAPSDEPAAAPIP